MSTRRERKETPLEDFVRREIEAIGLIDSAMEAKPAAEVTTLYRFLREGKQSSIEQLAALARRAGGRPPEPGPGLWARVEGAVRGRIGEDAVLEALRDSGKEILEAYEGSARSAGDPLEREAYETLAGRSRVSWTIVSAHVAQRKDEAGLRSAALRSFFASGRARVCMRCLLDRPGTREALERSDPDPFTYVCGACHDEVLADVPPDQEPLFTRLGEAARRNKVIQKALGRPSRLKAQTTVLRALAGLPPSIPEKPRKAKAIPAGRSGPTGPAENPPVDTRHSREDASPSELRYTDVLFDPAAVRRSW